MTPEVQTVHLDEDIKRYEDDISMGEAVERFMNSRDFKRVINQGYFKDYANNLVMQRAMPAMRSNEILMASNERKIDAVSELNFYLHQVKAKAEDARQRLASAEELRTQIESGVYDDIAEDDEQMGV